MMRVPLQKRGPDTQALGQTAPAPRFSAFGIGRRLSGAVAALALMFLFFVGISIAVQLYVAHSAAHLEARNVAEALAAAGHDKVLDDAKHTQSIVSGLHAASGRDVFVVDRNLRILADSTEREIGTTFDDADGGAVAATLRDGQSRTFRERDGHGDQTLKQIVVPLRQDRLDPNSAIAGALILEYTQLERELMQTALTGTAALGGFGLVCMLLAVRFGMRLVGSIGRPLAELHAAVRAMAAGRRSTRAPVLANDEIGLVAAAFNVMAGELEASHAELAAHAERLQKHGDDLTAANRLLEREVRDRRLAEMELRKLGTALEQCPAVVLVCGLNGCIEYANAAFTLCTGFRMDEALGRDPLLLLAGMAARQDQPLVWGRISAASGWSGELRNRRKSGEQYLERVTVTPVHGTDGTPTHYLWVGEDISEQTRVMAELLRYRDTLEELVAERTAQLAAARDAAQQASRAKGTFLANMSHEIRTALNAVIGLTHILSRQISDAAQRRTLRKMDGAARHLLAVVNDILDLSKIEAGAIVLEALPFLPAQIVENAVEIMRPRADTKNLPLLCDIAAGLQGRTYVGDPTRLSQVLLNFVSNAVKFTERGEVRLGMALEEEDATSALLRFEVRDTGRGIARAAQERLFKEFEQADDTITRLYGGSGLGLAINRRLVELMGGSIFVDSAPGRGSTFVFTARVAQLTGTGCVDAALDVDHAREELKRRHGGARILVVDDDGDNRDVAQWLVEDAGLTADVACNGAAALDMLGEASYALVLMDVYMPVLDGLAATRAIRARPGHIHVPVIAMTASVFVEDRARCIAAGMNDHVPKPVDAAQLYAKMLEWMGHDNSDAGTGRPGQNIAWSDYSGS